MESDIAILCDAQEQKSTIFRGGRLLCEVIWVPPVSIAERRQRDRFVLLSGGTITEQGVAGENREE